MPSSDWTQDYSPKSFSRSEFVLPEEHRKIFEEYAKGKRTQHLLLTGNFGTGKTSVGQVLRKKAQSEFFISCTEYKQEKHWVEKGAGWKFIFSSQIPSFSPSEKRNRPIGKFVLLDELDQLKTQEMLRNILDEAGKRKIIICMTSNYPKKIDPAIHSRCTNIHFGTGDLLWDNYAEQNPPGNREDIENQLVDLVVKIAEKEAKVDNGELDSTSMLFTIGLCARARAA